MVSDQCKDMYSAVRSFAPWRLPHPKSGMQRPDLVWRPALDTVLENSDFDDAAAAFSSVRVAEQFSEPFVCPSITSENAEIHQVMKMAVSSP